MAEFIVLTLVPALIVAAAVYDLTTFTIPNWLTLSLVLAFAVFAVILKADLGLLGWHMLVSLVFLLCGMLLFGLSLIGGGDAKLLAFAGLWLGPGAALEFAFYSTVMGGFLTLAILAFRRMPIPGPAADMPWVSRLHDANSGVPYGVALAAGALILLPSSPLFLLAAV